MHDRPVLTVGALAYLDAFLAIIPCKVLKIEGASGAPGVQLVTVKLTADRKAYKRGEILMSYGMCVIPRAAFYWRRSGARIGYYTVQA